MRWARQGNQSVGQARSPVHVLVPAVELGVPPREGTRVGVAGYPRTQVLFGQLGLGLTPSVHLGTVNALPAGGALIQFDAQIEPGNSGGPLFDANNGVRPADVTIFSRNPSLFTSGGGERSSPSPVRYIQLGYRV